VQRQQGLALERQHGLAQVLEPQVLVLVLALKQLMVLQALVLVQLRAARALALAKQKLLAVVFDLDFALDLVLALA